MKVTKIDKILENIQKIVAIYVTLQYYIYMRKIHGGGCVKAMPEYT